MIACTLIHTIRIRILGGLALSLLYFGSSAPFANAELTGQVQQLSPTPQTYVQGPDFQLFFDNGTAATGSIVGLLQTVAGKGAAFDFGEFMPGNIALIERGDLPFYEKVNNATAAGAIGVVIYNHMASPPPQGTFTTVLTTVPAVLISQALGQQFLDQLQSGPVEVSIHIERVPEPSTGALMMSVLLVLGGYQISPRLRCALLR